MKLFLTALCASFMIIPSSFASECEKGKCGKEKKEEGTVLADCGKCKKKEGEEKKEGGTVIADCGKCKKDGEKKKEEGALAGKCKKDCDKEEAKEEGTLA